MSFNNFKESDDEEFDDEDDYRSKLSEKKETLRKQCKNKKLLNKIYTIIMWIVNKTVCGTDQLW